MKKKKTSNTELPITRWIGDGRVKEAPEYGAAQKTDSTPNEENREVIVRFARLCGCW